MHTTRFISQAKSRPTIGLITARLKGPTEINLWHGIEDRAQECDVNLICFSGGIPKWPYEYEAQKNILFKIAGPQNLNGLLIWSNILGHTLDREEIELFCSKYAPLPVINMGISLDTIPSIFFDMREGMRNLMAHLFEKHACQRIAFIRGLEVSQDAEERFQAYMDSLEAYGIPFDPQLVQPGDFRRPSAYAATERLLDLFGTSIDAIVSANDNMAIGVVQSLQKQGIRVPEDIIVVGFDDIEETIAISPSLTTVRTPWYEMGSKSVDMLLARLKGEPSPEPIKLQTELILGQSCGCRSLPVIQYPLVFRPFAEKAPKDTQNLELVCNSLIEEIRRKVASTDAIRGLHKDWPTILVNSFLTDVYGKESLTFLTTLENYLNAIIYGAEIMEWRDVIGSIQIHLLPVFTTEEDILYAIELMQRAHHLIGDIAHRKQLQQRLTAEEQADRLNHIIQAMSAIHEIDQLMELLAHELPDLGINTCFLSLYEGEGNPPELSRLIMASNSQGRVPLDEGGELFHTKNLVPANLLPPHRRYSFDVEALFFREEQMGFVVLELGSRNGDVYTALRGHISSVLKSAQLVQKIKDAEARAVKADQLKTRLLANVSHELRAPLNIIVGFSQTAMSTPNPYGIDLPDLLLHDLTHIYTSGEHLIRMINDLLDTSRAEIDELDLWMEYIDTRSFLEETYSSFASKGRMKKNAIEWIVDIPENIPVLYADPARLRQILNNLMSNAEKFTDAGQVVLGARVQVPHLHLWVADTGFGIPVDQQEQIFEPFIKINKSDRRYEGLGLGLSITRRLVALHGGSMTLDSRTGHGSTFHVYLPLPNLAGQTIQVFDKENVQPILLCLSTIAEPGAAIEDLCISNGYKLLCIRAKDDLNTVLRGGKPAALAWDMTHAMPADWSVIQTLRNHPQICQLPFLLFNREKSGGLVGTTQITEVLLKPVNKSILSDMIASFCP